MPGRLPGWRAIDAGLVCSRSGAHCYDSRHPPSPRTSWCRGQSLGPPFTKGGGVQGRRPWSLPAGSEILLCRRAHFSLLTFFLKEKKKVGRRPRFRRNRAFRPALDYPANTPRWGVLQSSGNFAGERPVRPVSCDPLKAAGKAAPQQNLMWDVVVPFQPMVGSLGGLALHPLWLQAQPKLRHNHKARRAG